MAFVANSARKNNTAPASEAPARNDDIGGYLNIGVKGSDGTVRRLGQGGRGIALRSSHPVESVVLAFIREHGVEAFTSKLEITFGDAEAVKDFSL